MAKIRVDYLRDNAFLVVDGVRFPSSAVLGMEVDMKTRELLVHVPITELVVDGEEIDMDDLRAFVGF